MDRNILASDKLKKQVKTHKSNDLCVFLFKPFIFNIIKLTPQLILLEVSPPRYALDKKDR